MRTLTAALVAIMLLAGAVPAAARILGGGDARADCYLTFEGIDSPNERVVECADGTFCDADGVADGRCTFAISVCLHAEDAEGCVAPVPTVLKLRNVKGARALVVAARTLLPASAAACAPATPVVVRLRKRGRRPGSRSIRMTAVTDTRPHQDVDHFRLVCVPASAP